MTIPVPSHGTVAERIRVVRNHLAPSELAVASAIIEGYPTSGLVPIAQIAAEAQVSGPTVLRLVNKLGFDGYAEFHAALRAEIQERIFSPVDAYPSSKRGGNGSTAAAKALAAYQECIRSTFTHLDAAELKSAVSALSDPKRPIYLMGGRVSSILASHVATYLSQLRRNVTQITSDGFGRNASMLDLDPKSVVVLFDYRHYQESTVSWGIEATKRRAHLILFTDQYLSPLAQHATSLLTCSTKGLDPFDSLVGAFALIELVIAEVARSMGAPARKRLADLLALQQREEQQASRGMTPLQKGQQER